MGRKRWKRAEWEVIGKEYEKKIKKNLTGQKAQKLRTKGKGLKYVSRNTHSPPPQEKRKKLWELDKKDIL